MKVLLSGPVLWRLIKMLVKVRLLKLFVSVSVVEVNFILFVLVRVHVSVSAPHSIQVGLAWYVAHLSVLGVLWVHLLSLSLLDGAWHFPWVIRSSIFNDFMTHSEAVYGLFEVIVLILVWVSIIRVSHSHKLDAFIADVHHLIIIYDVWAVIIEEIIQLRWAHLPCLKVRVSLVLESILFDGVHCGHWIDSAWALVWGVRIQNIHVRSCVSICIKFGVCLLLNFISLPI